MDHDAEKQKLRDSLEQHAVLVEQYEGRFSQLRDLLEDREREAQQRTADLQLVNEDLAGRVTRSDKRVQELEGERAQMAAELKELKWALDQQGKRAAREAQRVREQCEEALAEKEGLLERLKSEAQMMLQRELQSRAGDHLKIEAEHAERRQVLDLEMAHLRDALDARDALIQDQRQKMGELQRRIEEQSLMQGRQQSEASRRVLELEGQVARLQTDLEKTSMVAHSEKAEL